MHPNPVLEKLGYSNNDRLVIFHADDIGMCHASLSAYRDLASYGLLSSAATMVPCAWFPATAAYCRRNQHSLPIDMGVHLTLTSEWDDYRWGPISSRDTQSGLIDSKGYFYASSEEVQAHADPDAVLREIDAQVERATAAGIDITHIDTHMGSCFHPNFLAQYLQTAVKYRVPVMILRQEEAEVAAYAAEQGIPSELATLYVRQMEALEGQGWPLLDNIAALSLEDATNRLKHARETLEDLPAGVTHFIVHPSKDTPELRAITPDWPARVADYKLFIDDAWRDVVESSDVRIVGYRDLQRLIGSDETEFGERSWDWPVIG